MAIWRQISPDLPHSCHILYRDAWPRRIHRYLGEHLQIRIITNIAESCYILPYIGKPGLAMPNVAKYCWLLWGVIESFGRLADLAKSRQISPYMVNSRQISHARPRNQPFRICPNIGKPPDRREATSYLGKPLISRPYRPVDCRSFPDIAGYSRIFVTLINLCKSS